MKKKIFKFFVFNPFSPIVPPPMQCPPVGQPVIEMDPFCDFFYIGNNSSYPMGVRLINDDGSLSESSDMPFLKIMPGSVRLVPYCALKYDLTKWVIITEGESMDAECVVEAFSKD